MKKIVLLFAVLLPLGLSYGQDTIMDFDPCYKFWPHRFPIVIYDTAPAIIPDIVGRVFERHDVAPGTMVYGVSLRGSYPLDGTVNVSLAMRDGDDSMYTFHDTAYLDSSRVYRYVTFSAQWKWGNGTTPFEYGEKCNEIYFHRPWTVRDTFYVCIRYNGTIYDYQKYKRLPLFTAPYDWPVAYQLVEDDGIPDVFCPSVYDTTLHDMWAFHEAWGKEWPIMEPNRKRCRKPSGLHVVETGNTWLLMSWDGGSGDSYRLTVEGPDSTFVHETADTALLLENLTSDANYWVTLESFCRYQYYAFDSTYLNPGSERREFHTGSVGVDSPDGLLQIVFRPNPASREVEIVSPQPMTRIEVTDILGRPIATFADLDATTATLDVSSWPRGAYIFRLTTPSATVVRKLLIR